MPFESPVETNAVFSCSLMKIFILFMIFINIFLIVFLIDRIPQKLFFYRLRKIAEG